MLELLSCSLGRKDEVPNIELAKQLCTTENRDGIKEIVNGLTSPNKAIANDCIKVLYEIGDRNPLLISDYADDFIALLSSKNNRLVWGGMTALAAIAEYCSEELYDNIEIILSAYENGSVITVDNCITLLARLCKSNGEYEEYIFPILIEHILTCRPKEIPQHAERMAICINKGNINEFLEAIEKRRKILTPAQDKRIKKLLEALN